MSRDGTPEWRHSEGKAAIDFGLTFSSVQKAAICRAANGMFSERIKELCTPTRAT